MANEVEIELSLEERDVVQGLNKINRSIDNFSNKADRNFKQSSQAFNVFKGSIAAAGVVKSFELIGDAAKSLFNIFITQGIESAQVQEDAINKLNVALRTTGKFSEETSKGIQQFASSLQQATTFGDELILENAALIQSLANLDQKGLQQATAASADLAAALGKDLRTASELVGKAVAGQTSVLTRYGVVVEKGATQAETFANTIQAINKQFGGAAAGQVNTFSGATKQLTDTFGDLTEISGSFVTKNETVLAVVKELNKTFFEAQGTLEDNRTSIESFVSEGLLTLIDSFGATARAADLLSRTTTVVFNSLTTGAGVLALGVVGPLALIEEAINTLIRNVPFLRDKFGEMSTGVADLSRQLSDSVQEDIKDIDEALNETTGLADLGLQFEEFSQKVRDSLGAENAAIEENKGKFKQASMAKVETKKEEADQLKSLREQTELAELEAEELEKLKREEDRGSKFNELQEELGIEAALRQQARENALESQGKADQASLERRKKLAENRKRIRESELKFEEVSAQRQIQVLQQTTSLAVQLSAEGGRRTFGVTKSLRLAESVINGIGAVQNALNAPFPLNIINASLVGALTAANVAKIAGSKPPAFQDGGVVGGNQFSGDNVLARVNSGELILNRTQQANLFALANSSTPAGNQEVIQAVAELAGAIQSQPINVELDGQLLATAVRNSVLDGNSIGV